MTQRKIAGWTTLILGAVLMFALWLLMVLVSAQPELKVLIDLSPQARFTVAPETREILAQLRDDPNLRVEFHVGFEPLRRGGTDDERQVIGIHVQLHRLTTELLRQYDYYGGESVKVAYHNVRGEVLDFPGAHGAKRNSVTVVLYSKDEDGNESSRHKSISVDLEMAIIDQGNPSPAPGAAQRRPPRLQDYRGEYAVSAALKSLLVQGAPKVYLIQGHQEEDARSSHARGYLELANGLVREGFKIGQVNLAKASVPDDAEVLACLEPKYEFSTDQAQKVLAFLRGGGRMFLNVGYEVRPVDWNPKLQNLLAPLGLELGTDLICQPRRARMSNPQEVLQLVIRRMNLVHKITAGLVRDKRYAALREAREIRAIEPRPDGVNVDLSLLVTDPTWLAPRGVDSMPDLAPPHDRSAYRSRCVGAIVDVLAPKGAPKNQRTGRLILLSGKALYNAFYKELGRVDLGLNIFQWLAERRALVTIRREPLSRRPVRFSRDPDERAEKLANIAWLLRAWVPGFMLLLGIVVLWRRSRL